MSVAAFYAMLLGAVKFFLPSSAPSDSGVGTAAVTLTFVSTGAVQYATTWSGSGTLGNWVTPTSFAPGAYTIRAHATSGSLSAGTVDTDLALTSSRSFEVSQSGAGTKSCTLELTLKDSGGATVATSTVSLTATAT